MDNVNPFLGKSGEFVCMKVKAVPLSGGVTITVTTHIPLNCLDNTMNHDFVGFVALVDA